METAGQLGRIVPDRRPSLTAIVTERLRGAIMSGELGLGEIVSEDGLAAKLGVSRTPVREGLMALQLQGLVVTRPQRGSFVFMPSEADVAELCEFRMVTESRALVLCHARAKEKTVAALVEANVAMRGAALAGDHLASAQADATFHEAFFAGCGNTYLVQAYSLASGRIGALRATLLRPEIDIQRGSIEEHDEIIEAFRTSDLLRAEAVLAGHIFRMRLRFASARDAFGHIAAREHAGSAYAVTKRGSRSSGAARTRRA